MESYCSLEVAGIGASMAIAKCHCSSFGEHGYCQEFPFQLIGLNFCHSWEGKGIELLSPMTSPHSLSMRKISPPSWSLARKNEDENEFLFLIFVLPLLVTHHSPIFKILSGYQLPALLASYSNS